MFRGAPLEATMATIKCARCSAVEDEASAGFTEDGLVCARCLRNEQEGDVAQMRRQVESARRGIEGDGGAGEGGEHIEARAQQAASRHAAAPATGATAVLVARGLRPQRSGVSRTVTTPLGTRASAGYAERWTLPQAPPVQAGFAAERGYHQVVKWFEAEVQTGDAVFDDRVYVQTSTPDATKALLAREDVRHVIGFVIERGGSIKVEGNLVEAEVLWPEEEPGRRDDDLAARFVLSLLDA